ncbi:DUF6517 family protein [Halopiger djelfimassiliensis]|uniref:DUF6517 family protein n=1 Tax=Halopiger djelfimassiliensis TaxID=1293047 RepID=UPI000677F29F|nr:DUF6517 family protein [Halopiger djelfimassiliensis]
MKRRTLLGGLGAAGLASLSGCLGLVGMAEHESIPADVDPAARDETGYERTNVEPIVVERDVGVGPVSETVVVTNHMTELEKAVDMGPLGRQRGAVFTVLSTPKVDLLGQNFNPVEEMSDTELVELVANNYDDIGNIDFEEKETVTILEQETTRSRFTADAKFNGTSVDVDLHVTEAVETDDDLLVTIGVYPRHLRTREEANVLTLMEGVVPTVDGDGSSDDSGAESADEDGSDGSDDGSDTEDTSESDGESEDTSDGDDGSTNSSDDGDDGGISLS